MADDLALALAVACPQCRRDRGDVCRSPSTGRPFRKHGRYQVHTRRTDAAVAAGVEPLPAAEVPAEPSREPGWQTAQLKIANSRFYGGF